MKVTGKVQTSGRLQLPKDIRKKLLIRDGDTLIVDILEVIPGQREVHA